MGYYTCYSMYCENTTEERAREIIDYLKKDADSNWNKIFDLEGRSALRIFPYEEAKWYEHDQDMRELSAKFPDVTLILEGEGEEPDDQWQHRFENGKLTGERYRIWNPEWTRI